MGSLKTLRSLNLNQLPILRQESITKAAHLLNLSQPAVSNALKTLRGHFGDELLTREGAAMRRTAKGQELLDALETALAFIETAVQGEEFDPAFATGPVRIATVDNVIGTFAAPMFGILEKEAPKLEIQFLVATRNLAHDLKQGGVDIAITSTQFIESPAVPESLRKELNTHPLGDEPLVCIGRKNDKELAKGLSLEAYFARPHATYIVDAEHHHTVEREHLRKLGLNQFTRISTSINLTLPGIVARSDCLAIVPATLAMQAAKHYPIQMFRPPLDLPDIKWVMVWHNRVADIPLMRWAMDAVVRVSKIGLRSSAAMED